MDYELSTPSKWDLIMISVFLTGCAFLVLLGIVYGIILLVSIGLGIFVG